MSKFLVSGALMLPLAATLASCGSDISGVYVGTSPTDAEMVQLVRSDDGKITGRIEQVLAKQDGSVSDQSVAVEGAADGAQIVLTPKATLSDGSGSQTGLVRNGTLELTWNGGHRSLTKSDPSRFAEEANRVRARGAKIVADNDTRAGLAILETASSQLRALTEAEPKMEEQLAGVSERFKGLGASLAIQRNYAESLRNTPGQGLAAMRAGTDAQREAVQVNALHGSLSQAEVNLAARIKSLGDAMAPVRKSCSERAPNLRDGQFVAMCAQADQLKQSAVQFAQKIEPAFQTAELSYRQAIGPQ